MDKIRELIKNLNEDLECYDNPATSDDQLDCLHDMLIHARELKDEIRKKVE